jgi:hypothetical protein
LRGLDEMSIKMDDFLKIDECVDKAMGLFVELKNMAKNGNKSELMELLNAMEIEVNRVFKIIE